MKITIINVEEPTQQLDRKGKPYYKSSVTFTNEFGKVEQKQLVSFMFPQVWEVLTKKNRGDTVEITRSKNEKGFWDWTAAGEAGPTTVASEKPSASPYAGSVGSSPSNTKPVSNYETREERAWRQVLIVRQSSVSAAVNLLKTEKNVPAVGEILAAATQIEDWVNKKDAAEAWADLPDDVPQ